MAVTIYDLAREAGVSISTASKALGDSYSVSEATKKRVRETAERMDYKPNARARSFARQSNGSVLFVTDLHRNIAFENPHMFEIMVGVTKYLDEKGYSLTLKHLTQEDAPEGIHELMVREQADGVILHAAILSRRLATVLMKADLPYVVIGKPDFPCGVCWMDANHELAGSLAGGYLLDKGYRRIAFIMGEKETDKISESRLAGVLSALEEEELTLQTLYSPGTYEAGIQKTRELLTAPQRPEVILCTNNYLSIGCLQALKQEKLRVPEDIALMTFDNYPFSMVVEPAITAVEADMYEMGWEIGRFILRRIKKPNLQTQSFCTIPTLLERPST